MMDHLIRAAAFDWQDESPEDPGRPADLTARPGAEAPRIGNVETLVSLRCPVGRLRGEPAEGPARQEPPPVAAAIPHSDGQVVGLTGRGHGPCRPSPDTGPPETVAARRPGDITATL